MPPLTPSNKQFSRLIAERSVVLSDDVLAGELTLCKHVWTKILSDFPANSEASKKAFLDKRGGSMEKASKLTKFVILLAELVGVEEFRSKELLSSYLASTYENVSKKKN